MTADEVEHIIGFPPRRFYSANVQIDFRLFTISGKGESAEDQELKTYWYGDDYAIAVTFDDNGTVIGVALAAVNTRLKSPSFLDRLRTWLGL